MQKIAASRSLRRHKSRKTRPKKVKPLSIDARQRQKDLEQFSQYVDSIIILPENYTSKMDSDIKQYTPIIKKLEKRLSLRDLRPKRYHMRRNVLQGTDHFTKKAKKPQNYTYTNPKLIPPKILRVPSHYKGKSLIQSQDKLNKRQAVKKKLIIDKLKKKTKNPFQSIYYTSAEMKDGVMVEKKKPEAVQKNPNFRSFRTCCGDSMEMVNLFKNSKERVSFSKENKKKLDEKLTILERLKNRKIDNLRKGLEDKVDSLRGKYKVFKLTKGEKSELDAVQGKYLREKWGEVMYIPGGKIDYFVMMAS